MLFVQNVIINVNKIRTAQTLLRVKNVSFGTIAIF